MFPRPFRNIRLSVIAAALIAIVFMSSVAAAAGPVPADDTFYVPAGSLAGIANGTVLKTRSVTLSLAGTSVPVTATQVLYKTVDTLGAPDATVVTVIPPVIPALSTKIVSFQTFYDGLNGICRPSYTLQQTEASPSATTVAAQTAMYNWLAQGNTVITADYEGSTDNFGAGKQSGRQTLDGIRAAESFLKASASTPVAMEGYSGGSIATMWAAEQHSSYAPELNIVGAAAAGIPPFFAHNLSYVSGSTGWAGALPAIALGLFRAYHVDPSTYLSPRGMSLFAKQAQGCLDQAGYPGLKFEDMLKPEYKDWKSVPLFVNIFNDSIMGRSGTPDFPLLMGVGNADGIGDGVMVAKDVQQLAYEYCQRNVNVNFTEYTHLDHYQAIAPFIASATPFITSVLNGVPVTSNCATVTPGNALTPLIAKTEPTSTGTTGTSGSGGSGDSGGTTPSTTAAVVPTAVDSGQAGDARTAIALTAGSTLLAMTALIGVAVVRRRWYQG